MKYVVVGEFVRKNGERIRPGTELPKDIDAEAIDKLVRKGCVQIDRSAASSKEEEKKTKGNDDGGDDEVTKESLMKKKLDDLKAEAEKLGADITEAKTKSDFADLILAQGTEAE